MQRQVEEGTRMVGGEATTPTKHTPLFERASEKWWKSQFSTPALEAQYWKCSFPQLRDRFRSGIIYICLTHLLWLLYLNIIGKFATFILLFLYAGLFLFSVCSSRYYRYYMPASFICVFLLCATTLIEFSRGASQFMSPIGKLTTSFQVILLIYAFVPLPLYLCFIIGAIYSILFEKFAVSDIAETSIPGIKFILHIGMHLIGIHLFILTQVQQRKTFLKVAQSLLARKNLESETQFKDHMIQSVMPKKVADELLRETVRRPSASHDSRNRTSYVSNDVGIPFSASAPNIRKFRPFTMNLMTDVSILFADIAGFTKMSSNKTADELVSLLNDLFGRFDYLCGKCNLEKISTLGDCYYCVAGCPEPRPDHARCCVEMGLSMIIAIRQFDMDRGQEVNMRVGIHTGKVMCGIVGIKRFKFDVFSNDVTFANIMESTGIAGRVHISEATAQFLGDEYILESGSTVSGKKNEFIEGVKTYFIAGRVRDIERMASRTASCSASSRDKVANKLKVFEAVSLPVVRNYAFSRGSLRMRTPGKHRESNSAQLLHYSECLDENSHASRSPPIEKRRKSASLEILSSANSRHFTKAELIGGKLSRDIVTEDSTCNNSLRGSKTSGFQVRENTYYFSVGGGIDTAISLHQNAASLSRFDTDNRDFDERLAQVIQGAEVNFTGGFYTHSNALNKWTLRFKESAMEQKYRAHFAESFDKQHSSATTQPERRNDPGMVQRYRYSGVFLDMVVAALLVIVCLVVLFIYLLYIYVPLAIIVPLFAIVFIGIPILKGHSTFPWAHQWLTRHTLGMTLIILPTGIALLLVPVCHRCISKEFLLHFCFSFHFRKFAYIFFLALFAHSNFSQLAAWPKTLQALILGSILIFMTFFWECLYLPNFQDFLYCKVNKTHDFPEPIFTWEICIDVFLTVILVGFLNYKFEAAFRISFFGDVQASRDTEQMQAVRDQADWLLTNIIPPNAIESLRNSTKYSENHALTAVLFATITNWYDMYEETFEGGREFLRVLNEIIGDFDELLDHPEFSQVEKIKTIGSAYMAASGLDPEKMREAQDPHEHLYQLMEFALALQQKLRFFNQDLLNFEFVCKIGLNIGPVTAGVIGTTKLYYDIWGDTVNIASRMYSTGVENRIQVSIHLE
ncbi:unnamed protein product [Enterobius vermicularis]|uniref:adenylate cyclase n=1 Tax=Enterobius vermicularis TaxID=51028 RepID=A0A0N4V9C8_ENTVE|nr:unnamed protein product [Enterobius vermicularis]